VQILFSKITTIPRCVQKFNLKLFVRDHSSVPAKILIKLPTYIGFAETDLPF
jgi:hypothetical protein